MAYCAAINRVPNPHFLFFAIPSSLIFICALLLFFKGFWQVFKGPSKGPALGWMALGMIPLLMWGMLFAYGYWVLSKRRLYINPPLLIIAATGASLLDGVTKWKFPHEHSGEHFDMISNQSKANQAELDAMDKHIKAMENLLGQQCTKRARWICGGAIGVSRRYMLGMVFGSPVDADPEENVLRSLDRHEMAHFVIEHLCNGLDFPPTAFIEGWAVSQAGGSSVSLALVAMRNRQEGVEHSLKKIFGPEYYHDQKIQAYNLGGALVAYILRTYGGPKFFELYTTCAEATIEEDIQHVLGVSVTELDKAFWNDVERILKENDIENPTAD